MLQCHDLKHYVAKKHRRKGNNLDFMIDLCDLNY